MYKLRKRVIFKTIHMQFVIFFNLWFTFNIFIQLGTVFRAPTVFITFVSIFYWKTWINFFFLVTRNNFVNCQIVLKMIDRNCVNKCTLLLCVHECANLWCYNINWKKTHASTYTRLDTYTHDRHIHPTDTHTSLVPIIRLIDL